MYRLNGLVPDADKVVSETLCDLVGLAGHDRRHVDAYEHRLVRLDCYQSVALRIRRHNVTIEVVSEGKEGMGGGEELTPCLP